MRLPARSPVATVLLLAVAVACSCAATIGRPWGASAWAAATVVGAALWRCPPRALSLRLSLLVVFWLTSVAALALVRSRHEGPLVALPLLGAPVPQRGLRFLTDVVLKSGLTVTWVTAMAARMSQTDFLRGLNGLPLPVAVASVTYLAVSSLTRVRDDVCQLVRAREARGRARGWLAVSTSAAMARSLMVLCATQAERQAFALAARGFAGRFPTSGVSRPSLLAWAVLPLGAALVWLVRLA